MLVKYGQDCVQVAAVIHLDVGTVQDHHHAEKNVIIQSDNASGFTHKNNFHLFSI